MSRDRYNYPDPDDMFADTRMTFGEHIEDLRSHLLRAIYGFLIAFLIAIPLGQPILRFIARPVEEQLGEFHKRHDARRAAEFQRSVNKANIPPVTLPLQLDEDVLVDTIGQRLGLAPRPKPLLYRMSRTYENLLDNLGIDFMVGPEKLNDHRFLEMPAKLSDPSKYVYEILSIQRQILPPQLSTLSVQEAFMVLFWVILMTGFVIASPWVFYQIWSFIAAGLYPHEKRLVNVYLPFSIALFLVGVFVCEFFVIPKAVEAMLWFNEFLGFQPDLRLNEWLGFAIFMPLVFGVSFQTPLVMLFLEKIGLFDVESYKGKRRMAWFLMAIFAAIITPSTDAFSMLFLLVPMGMLYELGIWLCILSPRPPEEEWETSEEEEMVEV